MQKMFSIAEVQTLVICSNSANKSCLLQVVHTKAIAALTQFCDFFYFAFIDKISLKQKKFTLWRMIQKIYELHNKWISGLSGTISFIIIIRLGCGCKVLLHPSHFPHTWDFYPLRTFCNPLMKKDVCFLFYLMSLTVLDRSPSL